MTDSGAATAAIKRRAAGAVVAVAVRTILVRAGGLIGTAIIARLMLPSEYGLAVFGLSVVMSAAFLADTGLGAGLIRRAEAPERADLQTVLGMQLCATTVLAVVIAAVALPFGRGGAVTAIMVASLPLLSFRTPAVILLERDLRFSRLARVEVSEMLVFNAWGVGMVALGFGPFGLATAAIARAVAGMLLAYKLVPEGRMLPRLDRARIRPLLGFGTLYQSLGLLQIARDQGLNLVILTFGGVTTLALWALAQRLLQLPHLLFSSLWRVSYPAMAQFRSATDDLRPVILDAVSFTALGTGVLVCALVGTGPAVVPAVFGDNWADAALALPAACLALQISGPVSVSSAGFLFAVGDVQTALRAVVCSSAVWVAGSALLVGPLGLLGLGLAACAAALTDALIMAAAIHRHTGARVLLPTIRPFVAAVAASALGWLVANAGSPTALRAALAGATAVTGYAALCLILNRSAVQAGARALRDVAARRRGAPAEPVPPAETAPAPA